MQGLVRSVVCALLATLAGMAIDVSATSDRPSYAQKWREAAARQAQVAQRRQREAQLRWVHERLRSAAHARMPNTLYASTSSPLPHAGLSCPVLLDEDNRAIYRRVLAEHGRSPAVFSTPGVATRKDTRSAGINVFAAGGQGSSGAPSWSSAKDTSSGHLTQASAWTSIFAKSTSETGQNVYLFPSASEPLREGFVRVINHSAEAGEVTIDPTDDSGREFDTVTLSIDARQTKHFNSGDLENGNEGKGLTGSTGSGQGDWRLSISSDLDIEVLSYIRTKDGFLTAMHDVAPEEEEGSWRIAIFNPGSNKNQVSRLRLINPGDALAEITVRGIDDGGNASGEVTLSLDAGTAEEFSAKQLEMGDSELDGMLGDGAGKWRLEVESDQPVVAMSLLESPTDHLTNLSTVPDVPVDGVYTVPLLPAAGVASGRQGFVRVINNSESSGEVAIQAYDESQRDYEPITLMIGANEVVHFNSDDLEQGSTSKGLSGGTGAGEGDWRLEFSSGLDIEVLSYIRMEDGFLTAMHDVAPSAGLRHRVAVFNPGSNRNQESLLRLINPDNQEAGVTIQGIDDRGMSGGDEVSLTLAAGASRTVEAWELESGADSLIGKLGDGSGKWQLMVTSDQPVVAMSLLRSPTGHMTNLSTAPVRGARGGALQTQTAEEVFQQLISGPVVQSKCIACHIDGGASGNTRLVFVPDSEADHKVTNLQVFRDFLDEVDDGAGYILNKIQGALGHGGGIQIAAGTDDYADMERFLSLLGEDVGLIAITPDTLFAGVTMESARSTLRRAAIVFAGRIPTDAEYESIRTGGLTNLRATIRGLMEGPEFHEFLIRASNDRLFTDRGERVIASVDRFVDFINKTYRLTEAANASGDASELRNWDNAVQYGAMRAPLELIARVAEQDLPYTEILTADYIMANPQVAEAYGASTAFDDSDDVHEFQPSEILSYYRDGGEYEIEVTPGIGERVIDPGPLSTIYPHAGILNTKVFLQRYPTTPTNRNRARSRWTYYHFLGLDIEKSASRTTDPVALADTNNPTMNNPACTVCHSVLDPVAGAFQNYGNEGLYRDQWGGLDALDEFYKRDRGISQSVTGQTQEGRETLSWSLPLVAGKNEVSVDFTNVFYDRDTEETGVVHLDVFRVLDDRGRLIGTVEFEDVAQTIVTRDCGRVYAEHLSLTGGSESDCTVWIPLEVDSPGEYVVEVVAWADPFPQYEEGFAQIAVATDAYRMGDNWYRDMRNPGFDGDLVPDADRSLSWLSRRIVADKRFAEATVKFWWPSIMGREVSEPPEDDADTHFEGVLLASGAEAAEVKRLATGFEHGFSGGSAYNLKDLLVEIVLSRWFRAASLTGDDPVRAAALARIGAKRLLTPEELAGKTLALTGFQWGRELNHREHPALAEPDALTGPYRLLYGGIDSRGITERATDLTSVMASVAKSHAVESSCPIVLREFFLLPDGGRHLFAGFDETFSPVLEFSSRFEIEADSWTEREVLSLSGALTSGPKTVAMRFTNFAADEDGERVVRVSQLNLLNDDGDSVDEVNLKDVAPSVAGCGESDAYNAETGERDHFNLRLLRGPCPPLAAEVQVPEDGTYTIEIIAWADRFGDEPAELVVSVESDSVDSAGSRAIKQKLVELHDSLLGLQIGIEAPDIARVYRLFLDVWERKRHIAHVEDDYFLGSQDCPYWGDQRYFEGILEDAIRPDEKGGHYVWHWDRIDDFLHNEADLRDRDGLARTWVVVLAYLLTDYRYLYL